MHTWAAPAPQGADWRESFERPRTHQIYSNKHIKCFWMAIYGRGAASSMFWVAQSWCRNAPARTRAQTHRHVRSADCRAPTPATYTRARQICAIKRCDRVSNTSAMLCTRRCPKCRPCYRDVLDCRCSYSGLDSGLGVAALHSKVAPLVPTQG